ncbi:MAG TPA: DUF5665 domain-containing protein [bacterium]|nr:DUF5665 domain-containing protein [bacterium]HPN93680.1 DUF5665 domain-containing protein [bacterium]
MPENANTGKERGDSASENKTFSLPDPGASVRLEPETIMNINKLADIFERMNLADYLTNMTKPKRVIALSFAIGIARGLGFVIGMTMVFGLVLVVLGKMIDLPLIGRYIAEIVDLVNEYARTSNGSGK